MKLQDMLKVTDKKGSMVFGKANDGEVGFVTSANCDNCNETSITWLWNNDHYNRNFHAYFQCEKCDSLAMIEQKKRRKKLGLK